MRLQRVCRGKRSRREEVPLSRFCLRNFGGGPTARQGGPLRRLLDVNFPKRRRANDGTLPNSNEGCNFRRINLSKVRGQNQAKTFSQVPCVRASALPRAVPRS